MWRSGEQCSVPRSRRGAARLRACSVLFNAPPIFSRPISLLRHPPCASRVASATGTSPTAPSRASSRASRGPARASTSASSAASTACNPNGINATIISSAADVVTRPSSNGIACCRAAAIRDWFFVGVRRTFAMGDVLGNEWRSLTGIHTLVLRHHLHFN